MGEGKLADTSTLRNEHAQCQRLLPLQLHSILWFTGCQSFQFACPGCPFTDTLVRPRTFRPRHVSKPNETDLSHLFLHLPSCYRDDVLEPTSVNEESAPRTENCELTTVFIAATPPGRLPSALSQSPSAIHSRVPRPLQPCACRLSDSCLEPARTHSSARRS